MTTNQLLDKVKIREADLWKTSTHTHDTYVKRQVTKLCLFLDSIKIPEFNEAPSVFMEVEII